METTITTAIVGLTNAVLQLVVSFGVGVSDAQRAAITAVVNAVLLLGALVWDQTHKTPPPARGA